MITDLFSEYLSLSDKMRAGYKSSLGNSYSLWEKFFTEITPAIPEIFQAIYGEVAGTHRDISVQKYMDFIPGYRLIHIEELEREFHTLMGLLDLDNICEARIKTIIPLLADYSSSYIFYAKTDNNKEAIFHFAPGDGLQKRHNSVELFFETIIAFYTENVFYLDDDGFLDYDFEKEGKIGVIHNPDIEYWIE